MPLSSAQRTICTPGIGQLCMHDDGGKACNAAAMMPVVKQRPASEGSLQELQPQSSFAQRHPSLAALAAYVVIVAAVAHTFNTRAPEQYVVGPPLPTFISECCRHRCPCMQPKRCLHCDERGAPDLHHFAGMYCTAGILWSTAACKWQLSSIHSVEALHCRTRRSTCRRRSCGVAATLRHGITASPPSQVHAHHCTLCCAI